MSYMRAISGYNSRCLEGFFSTKLSRIALGPTESAAECGGLTQTESQAHLSPPFKFAVKKTVGLYRSYHMCSLVLARENFTLIFTLD